MVTDKETDAITEKMFKEFKNEKDNLWNVLSKSKSSTSDEYLNGGAIVLYGLPTYVHKSLKNKK